MELAAVKVLGQVGERLVHGVGAQDGGRGRVVAGVAPHSRDGGWGTAELMHHVANVLVKGEGLDVAVHDRDVVRRGNNVQRLARDGEGEGRARVVEVLSTEAR